MQAKWPLALLAAVLALGALWAFSSKAPMPAVVFVPLDGPSIPSSELRGKVVLINFWATSCVSCIREMPMLAATHEKFAARGFETIAVAMEYDPPEQVRAYVERNPLPFTVALDSRGDVAQSFDDVRLTPTTFLVDREGRIQQKILGEPDKERLHARIEQLLGASVRN